KEQWFPHLPDWFEQIRDPRLFHKYSMSNLLSQGMFLFLSGESSRNAANNRARHGLCYKKNFSRLFEGMQWAHLDTMDDLFRNLDWRDVEQVKAKMIRSLVKKKRLKTVGGYYLVAIDGSGITTYDEKQRENLVHKK